jgi:hypothetical protein
MTYRNLMGSCAVTLLAAATLFAQGRAAGKIPRTADGHLDLSGLWNNSTRTPLERPAQFAGKPTLTDAEAKAYEAKDHQAWQELDGTSEGPLHVGKGSEGTGAYNVLFYDMGNELARIDGVKRTSLVVDPPDGRIPPMVPAARGRRGRSQSYDNVKDRPATERCLVGGSTGPPMLPTLYNNNFQIIQTPEAVMIMTEMIHEVRVVRINASHPPEDVRHWLGDSIGHWEGDTLVVETTNFNDEPHFRGASKNLKVTERFTRVDDHTFVYKATLDDPATWSKPWTLEIPFVATPGPIYEYACHEGNYSLTNMLRGFRAAEGKPPGAPRR